MLPGKGAESMDLSGKLLIAMPGMGDHRFNRSVILLFSHSTSGAMGLIINKQVPDLQLHGLMEHLGIAPARLGRDDPVHSGGPVERARGFVLHSEDWAAPNDDTLHVPGGLCMTQSRAVLEALAQGDGPEELIVALGYSGWGAGQLDAEIAANAWLTADADASVVFGTECALKWSTSLRRLGIEPVALSAMSGRA
jgi:putative transcriptional regulator